MTEETKRPFEETAKAPVGDTGETPAAENAAEPELTGKEAKREEKHYKEENKKLAEQLAEAAAALEKAQSELADVTDKYMRVCAEYENFRRRSVKEREGIYSDAYADALKEIIPVIDNLERAANFTGPEQLGEGMKLIFKSAKDMLEKLGVEAFGEPGEAFDPNLHNAVMHVEDESLGEGVITDVFQKGYRKGDKIIRHAMVKTAN